MGKIARVVEPPPEKVLNGALEASEELYQAIADVPHLSYFGDTDSTAKIREGREQAQINVEILTQLRTELLKLVSKYNPFNQGRGLGLFSRERIQLIQDQLKKVSILVEKIDEVLLNTRHSENQMYLQELVAEKRENAKLPKKVTRGIVHQIPSKVQPSLVQSDINYYSKEIAITIATIPVGGFAIRLAGKGLNAIRAARAAKGIDKPRIYNYSYSHTFEGNVLRSGAAGRAWATTSAPGPWAFEKGTLHAINRLIRTGRIRKFNSVKEITGPARDLFERVRAIGPARGWKRLGGQYSTKKPGDVDLVLAEILKATPKQWVRFGEDFFVYHTLDGALVYNAGRLLYFEAKLFFDKE